MAARSLMVAFAALIATVAVGAAAPATDRTSAGSSAPPNLLIVMADDVGYNDLGTFGSPVIRTPHLDRMAAEGMKLTQFSSAAPICTPSRAALLTGRLPIRVGAYTNESYPLDVIFRVFLPSSVGCLPETEVTLADLLRDKGYYTTAIGKWHLGHNPARGCPPNDKGFDYFYGLPYSHEEGFPGPGPEGIIWPPVPLYENYDLIEQPINFTSLTPRYTQHVLDILDNTTKTGTPLFMYLGYEECHVPLFAARDFQNASRRGPYGDMMEQMDASIGTIMDKIRSTPALADNTIVLFTSDNGAWLAPSTGVPGAAGNPLWGGSNAPFRGGKGSTWEGGFREPAIVWAPGRVPASSVSYEPTTMMDILPTFAEYAGVQLPAGITYDGKSIVSVLNGTLAATPGAAPVHNYIWYWREKTLYAARHGQYKAHFFTRPGFGTDNATAHNPPLLFNVEHDPAEANALNASLYADELATIIAASKAHVASITPSVSEYEAQDWKLVPCCHKKFDWHQAMEFVSEGKLGLAIWDSCVCTNNTDVPVA